MCGNPITIVGNIPTFCNQYYNELFVFIFFLATTHVAFSEATVFQSTTIEVQQPSYELF